MLFRMTANQSAPGFVFHVVDPLEMLFDHVAGANEQNTGLTDIWPFVCNSVKYMLCQRLYFEICLMTNGSCQMDTAVK